MILNVHRRADDRVRELPTEEYEEEEPDAAIVLLHAIDGSKCESRTARHGSTHPTVTSVSLFKSSSSSVPRI